LGIIKVNNIRIFAYHGCLKEETKIGSDYRVDVKVKADLSKSSKTDQLKDTVDIFKEDQLSTKATVWISKLNPPIGGDVEMVTIKMTDKRKN